ncbi:hypothetical protein TRIUR3_19478 [Triticum urartu]|uniref:Uncharacterized protein n=1 Tax=Triticum urartu TaxID=4572 RepID=M7YH21_TRIUA|nr:hypothetical protein TRIUR3_19478 [Triticum urartu]
MQLQRQHLQRLFAKGKLTTYRIQRIQKQGWSLGGGELGNGLGALGDGVLGELAREDEADGGLDLPGGDGGLLVVPRQLGRLPGELLEDVVDEGVHDGHGLGGDADVGVHLLEHLEDVDLVRLHALLGLLLPLLLASAAGGRFSALVFFAVVVFSAFSATGFFSALGAMGAEADDSRVWGDEFGSTVMGGCRCCDVG